MLNISKEIENGKCTLTLEGRLDTVTAPDLEKEMPAVVEEANELIMDFEKLEYISSAGLRVLLMAHKTMAKKGGLKVVRVNETIMEIFEVTGFADILTVET